MSRDLGRRQRRSIRLPGYDYRSPRAYFVTLCTRGRECMLDDPVVAGIIADVWHALPGWFPTITLDEFVEHVIRNERELDAIRRYIRDNPANLHLLPSPQEVTDYLMDVQVASNGWDEE